MFWVLEVVSLFVDISLRPKSKHLAVEHHVLPKYPLKISQGKSANKASGLRLYGPHKETAKRAGHYFVVRDYISFHFLQARLEPDEVASLEPK